MAVSFSLIGVLVIYIAGVSLLFGTMPAQRSYWVVEDTLNWSYFEGVYY